MSINNLSLAVSNPGSSVLSQANTNASTTNNNAATAAVTALPVEPVQSTQAVGLSSSDQVQQAVTQIKQVAEKLAQNLHFSIDDDTGITVVKITDSSTQEVIRQIPTEEAVSIAKTLDKVQGLLFSEKA